MLIAFSLVVLRENMRSKDDDRFSETAVLHTGATLFFSKKESSAHEAFVNRDKS